MINFKRYRNKILTVFLMLALPVFAALASPQKKTSAGDSLFMQFETRLQIISKNLSETRYNDVLQDSLAKKLQQVMDSALSLENSYKYPFDRIEQISQVKSSDGSVRLFTWFSLKSNNTFRYYGFIQYFQKATKKNLVFPLVDNKQEITNPESAMLNAQNWYGALYYEILENKSESDIIYTLLGWDGYGAFSTKKVIDVLTFTENGKPKFGKAIFKAGKKKDKRLIFEFNKRATMMITFDQDLKMIVLDHLAPINNQSGDNPAFLGPDMSYDGLKFSDGIWEYQSNVDYKPSKRSKKNR